ncbi:hypothetical protein HD554DRAFT_2035559 [Boletus coccyginus]|nr:hypothetical protein HD554DRAFT_2035559 [Boletus coccyginus]
MTINREEKNTERSWEQGFSLLMFGGTIWTLLSQRSTRQVNRKMFTVACLLLLISTVISDRDLFRADMKHLVINIIRVMNGLILYEDTYPGGPVAYFSDVSQWTFYVKNLVYTAQTLVGDAVVLYRCYVVWQSKLVMVFPLLLWVATTVTGLMSGLTAEDTTGHGVYAGTLDQWITSFRALALAANLLATLLLIFRIWFVHREVTKLGASNGRSQMRSILHILVDSGVIYSVTLVVALICFITPIISITFYMVIIRVGLAARAGQTTHVSFGNISIMMDSDLRAERLGRRGMQVHITRLTESKIDLDQCSPLGITSPSISPNEIKFDGEGEV